MNREEALKIIEENRIFYRDYKKEQFDEALEYLKQPITLADFLGWEENVVYVDTEYPEYIYKIKNDTLYEIIGQSLVIDCSYCFSKFSIEELRQFKKFVEVQE